MAGLGHAWGTREEFLHPRDSHGRFRNTWRMPKAAAEAIANFLETFNPRTFTSDQLAQTYVHDHARSNRHLTNSGAAIDNFMKGFSNVQRDARAGKSSRDIDFMDKAMQPLPDDLILTRVVDPSAFGLDAQTAPNLEELTGKLVHDKGFTPANIGTPLPHQAGQVTMTIATPKGTNAIVPSIGAPTAEVILPRDQNLRVTKVTPDGQGGFHIMAVAVAGGTPKEKSTPLTKEHLATPADLPAPAQQPAGAPAAPNAPEAPAAPGAGPAARNEPHVVESLTPGGTVTPAATPDTPATPAAPTPAAPQTPTVDETPALPLVNFRQAVKEAGLEVPSAGKRRQQWNNAYLGIINTKKHPEDVLRELDADIKYNKSLIEEDKATGTDSGPLIGDVKAQEDLANLIRDKYNLDGGNKKTPEAPISKKAAKKVTKAAPAKAAPAKAAPAKAAPTEATGKTATPGISMEELTKDPRFQDAVQEMAGAEAARRGMPLPPNATPAARRGFESAQKDVTPTASEVVSTPGTGELTGKETIAQLRQIAKDKGIKIPSSVRLKADIISTITKGGVTPSTSTPTKVAKKAAAKVTPAVPAEPKVNKTSPKYLSLVNAIEKNKIEGDGNAGYNNILRNVKSGEWSAVKARRQALDSSGYWQEQATAAMSNGRMDPEARRKHIDDLVATSGKFDKLADEILISQDVTRTSKFQPKSVKPSVESGTDLSEKSTLAQLRAHAKEKGIKVPSRLTRKADILAFLQGGGESPGTTKSSLEDRVTKLLLDKLPPDTRTRVLNDMPASDRKLVDEAVSRANGVAPGGKTSAEDLEKGLSEAKTRDEAMKLLTDQKMTLPQIRELMKSLKVTSTKTRKDDLLKEIVSNTTGRRLNSDVIRGRDKSGAPVRRIPNFSMSRGEDRGVPIAEKYNRTRGDKPLYLPNGGADQGLVHLDSELGKLWQDLVADDRLPNSDVNAIAHIGEDVGRGTLSLQEAADRLKRMSKDAPDRSIAARIDQAIKGITEPGSVPRIDVPDNTPAPIKEWLTGLAHIPTMRKDRFPGASRNKSVLDEALDLVRMVSSTPRSEWTERFPQQKLSQLTHNIHESVDGVYPARELTDRTFVGPRMITGYRDVGGRLVAIVEDNPDWPAIRDWLRGLKKE